jgi:DnaJ like chaperone protein
MAWKGKFFGALIGFLLTRSVWGAVLGTIIGQLFDQGMMAGPARAPSLSVSEVFFRTTFEIMGHVAKSDGRVSEAEIQAARRLMQELHLGPSEVALAIECFGTGKAANYDFEFGIERLREVCGQRHDLLRTFIELQVRAALAGNGLSPPARGILTRMAERLGMSGLEFARMEAAFRARQHFQDQFTAGRSGAGERARTGGAGGASGAGGMGGAGARGAKSIADFYAELEIDAGVSNAEVKKAYRRQMSRHHPDKLVANGLPESMAQMAKEKTQRIQEAYEEIRAVRGMR